MTSTAGFRFTIGEFECLCLDDGTGPRDALGVLRGASPEIIADLIRHYDPDPAAVPWSRNLLYVRTADHHVLIDTGLGQSNLAERLALAGVEAAQIDHVVLTHGHGDHISGITDESGTLLFPNARFVMWRGEWDLCIQRANQPEKPDAAARKNLFPIEDRVDLIDAEAEIVPGLRLIAAPGHTPFHAAVWIESNGEALLHIADAMHHPAQIELPEIYAQFDAQPEVATETRSALLQRIGTHDNAWLLAYHFAHPGLGRVTTEGGERRWEKVEAQAG
jgi:glyoxylase-like metal-dependent hydrolase (beta-lactamase superfamily II)